jgi:hypothetical protein
MRAAAASFRCSGRCYREQAVTKLREIGEVSKWIGGHGTAAFGDGRVDGS